MVATMERKILVLFLLLLPPALGAEVETVAEGEKLFEVDARFIVMKGSGAETISSDKAKLFLHRGGLIGKRITVKDGHNVYQIETAVRITPLAHEGDLLMTRIESEATLVATMGKESVLVGVPQERDEIFRLSEVSSSLFELFNDIFLNFRIILDLKFRPFEATGTDNVVRDLLGEYRTRPISLKINTYLLEGEERVLLDEATLLALEGKTVSYSYTGASMRPEEKAEGADGTPASDTSPAGRDDLISGNLFGDEEIEEEGVIGPRFRIAKKKSKKQKMNERNKLMKAVKKGKVPLRLKSSESTTDFPKEEVLISLKPIYATDLDARIETEISGNLVDFDDGRVIPLHINMTKDVASGDKIEIDPFPYLEPRCRPTRHYLFEIEVSL